MQYIPSDRLEASSLSSGTEPKDHMLTSFSEMNFYPEISSFVFW